MSEFKVETSKLKNDASRERQIGPKIQALASEISAIAGSISFDSSVKQQIQRNLRSISQSSVELGKKVTGLSSALETIASYYEQTENRLSGQGDKGGSIGDRIRDARENLRDLRDILGMDGASAFSSDPVNLTNGNYVYEKSFYDYDTLIPMTLRIFYNIMESREASLGRGWRHNYEICLLNEGEQYGVLFEDGTERLFRRTEEGFEPYAGTEGTLEHADDIYVYTDSESIRYCFDEEGRAVCIKTQDDWRIDLMYEDGRLAGAVCTDGVALTFRYAGDGHLEAVSDQAGREVLFSYDGSRLCAAADAAGSVTRYQYDEKGRLCCVITPEGSSGLQNWYDEQDRTIRQLFPDGGVVLYDYRDSDNTVAMTRQNDTTVLYVHDDRKRNVRNIYPDGEESFTYDADNHRTSYTDKNGNVTRYAYDEKGHLTAFTNALGNTMSFRYTPSGKLEEFSLEDTVLGRSFYDEKDHQIRHTNANGHDVSFDYDEKGRVTAVTHEDGSTTRLSYDDFGNVIRVEEPGTGATLYEYDDCRRVVSSVDALGRMFRYAYDNADQLTEVTDPEGNVRTYRYDRRGNLEQVTDFNGGVTKVEYDDCGRPVRFTDSDGYTTLFEHDLMGNVVRKTAADGGVTEYGYDSEGRRIRIQDPMGGVETAEYDPAGNMIRRTAQDGGVYTFSYDALHRPVEVTDPLGRKRCAEFDIFGNVTRITYEDGSSEAFEFDPEGNQTSFTDACGRTMRFRYDALGNLTESRDDKGILERFEYYPGGLLAAGYRQDGSKTSYTYDPVGNIVRMEDSRDGVWNLSYDYMDRVVRAEHEGGETESYEYDVMGNITAVIDGEGNRTAYEYSLNGTLLAAVTAEGLETRYGYDSCYRLTSILKKAAGGPDTEGLNSASRVTGETQLISYKRDLNGNVLSIREADGGVTEFFYDACGRVIRKKDADGFETSCRYAPDGTEQIIGFSDGRQIRYQYDALKRLDRIEDWLGISSFRKDAAGRLVSAEDAAGNRMSWGWSDRGECEEITYPDGKKIRYGYDEAGRLASADVDGRRAVWAYDENGRLARRSLPGGLASEYAYDIAGRVSSLTNLKDGQILGRLNYDYDGCGRKKSLREYTGTEGKEDIYSFRYSPGGFLTDVFRNGEAAEHYGYDGFGNRVFSNIGGVMTQYRYDEAGRLISSLSKGGPDDPRGAVRTDYSYDRRGNLRSKHINGVEKLSLHFGALNRLERAVAGEKTVSYRYDGLARLTGRSETAGGKTHERLFFHDYRRDPDQLLAVTDNGRVQDYFWDGQPFFTSGFMGNAEVLHDERMTARFVQTGTDIGRAFGFSTFGTVPAEGQPVAGFSAGGFGENGILPFGYASYLPDPVTGFFHAGYREYDPSTGRFISRDPDAGSMMRPVTLNAFLYCMSDPINHYDPTGMVVAWLAAGIVGAAGNVIGKFAGDVVRSVKNGKWSGSSWQSYVGTAAGGFVQGSVYVVAGPTTAGAAGAATETLVTGGLSMATGAKGYRKEDGYTFGKLLGDTAVSGAKGAVTGFVFGKAGEHMTKYARWNKITKGTGSHESVWKQLMTKATRGQIKNISWKSIGKGLTSYGLARGVDKMIKEGLKEVKEGAKEYAVKKGRELFDMLKSGLGATSAMGAVKSLDYLSGRKMSAACPAAGM